MWNYIENILSSFRSLFSRRAAYQWFAVITIGIMTRTDKLGLTSIVRSLCLRPSAYESIVKFFKASSWSLDEVRAHWCDTVREHASLFCIGGRPVLVGDGVKQSKEGRHMPGVKRMAQESETQTKPDMIHGHMWGCTGILIGTDAGHMACTPVSMRIHDGLQAAEEWQAPGTSGSSHVVRMVQDACRAAQHFGSSYCLLDRYFLTVPALEELEKQNGENDCRVDLITKAKRSAAAYMPAPPKKPGQKGRPRKKGEKVKLWGLFKSLRDSFTAASAVMYGKKQDIRYYCIDLLWGQGRYQKLRFVLVEYNSTRSILVSTDLSLDPVKIIEAYCLRFRIETAFREFKQQAGGMAYHFWTKAMPRLDHFRKKTDPDPLGFVSRESDREKILKTIRASEMYVMMSCIAMGIIQMLSLDPKYCIPPEELRYQRTPAKEKPSEANIMYYLRQNIFAFMGTQADSGIMQIIRNLQKDFSNTPNDKTA